MMMNGRCFVLDQMLSWNFIGLLTKRNATETHYYTTAKICGRIMLWRCRRRRRRRRRRLVCGHIGFRNLSFDGVN